MGYILIPRTSYTIAEITLKSYIIYCFDDISSCKPQTNDALITLLRQYLVEYVVFQ